MAIVGWILVAANLIFLALTARMIGALAAQREWKTIPWLALSASAHILALMLLGYGLDRT